MQLKQIFSRSVPPKLEGKIPWNDPDFSRRMLENHLSQEHDWASRRGPIIEVQTSHIISRLPPGAAVLDLGCGPGLYTEKLAQAGCLCTGVDFSPASVHYAAERARGLGLSATYILADIREYEPAPGVRGKYNAVLMLFGEINVFSKKEAARILKAAAKALKPEGVLFLEVHSFDEVRRQGEQPPTWQAETTGLFSERPHVLLQEHFWEPDRSASVTRYMVVDAETAEYSEYTSAMTAYPEAEFARLLDAAGFAAPSPIPAGVWPVGKEFAGRLLPIASTLRQTDGR